MRDKFEITHPQFEAACEDAKTLGHYWGLRAALTRVRNASRCGENDELIQELYDDCIKLGQTIKPTPPAPPPLANSARSAA